MKAIRRFAICIMVFVICIILPISTLASPVYDEAEISLLQNGDYDIDYSSESALPGVSLLDVNMTDKERELEAKIYEQLTLVNPDIGFSWFDGLSMAWAKSMMADVINDHPELFYVSTNFNTASSSGRITNIYPKYSMTKAEIESARKVFDAGVSKAIAQVDSTMDDLQKALVIHDYICDNSYYCENGDVSHSAYGFFKDGKVVCAGYTLAYSYIMNKLGVPCEYVTSMSMSHAWNTIKIGGKWYNVDLTYDNEIRSVCPSQNRCVYGVTRHNWFMKSDKYFEADHSGRDTFDDCDGTSTAYDSAFWDDCYTNIVVSDGNYYYIDTNPSYGTASLIQRDKNGNERSVCSRNFYFVDNNSVNTNGYKEEFIRLAMVDNKFVVAAGNSNSNRYIYLVDKKGNVSYLKSLSTYPVGLTVKDGNVVYQLSNLNEQVIDKMSYFRSSLTTKKGTNYNTYPDVNDDGYVNARDYILINGRK